MKESKVHIYDWNIADNFFSCRVLCGRLFRKLRRYPVEVNSINMKKKFNWCKTCKMLFNADHSVKYRKILK